LVLFFNNNKKRYKSKPKIETFNPITKRVLPLLSVVYDIGLEKKGQGLDLFIFNKIQVFQLYFENSLEVSRPKIRQHFHV